MAYIGKTPVIGNFQKCDSIAVVNGQAAYTLQVGGTNVSPQSENHMLVSLNGILQAPVDSFTVSGSTLTFASNLITGDVIDFVMILGNVLDLGVPSDNTVSLAKLTATGTKDATTFLRGDNTFAEAGGGLQSIQSFTSSGTYTKPSGINKIKVYITGGGGGGGSSGNTAHFSGGGGAGGGTAIEILDATSITTVTVTIGSGGAGGNSANKTGSNGGTSSFGSYCSATGGTGGGYGGAMGGLLSGGIGSNGDLNLKGNAGKGAHDNNSFPNTAGQGGGSFWGGAGYGRYAASGEAGVLGGGGGAGNTNTGSLFNGGAGGDGFCVVEEYK